jgi:hypothetical protein
MKDALCECNGHLMNEVHEVGVRRLSHKEVDERMGRECEKSG